MGMFDEVTWRAHPLDLDLPETGWQTKDFECNLDRIEFRTDGTVWITPLRLEVAPRVPAGEATRWPMPLLRAIPTQPGRSHITVTAEVYQKIDKLWVEFDVEIVDGVITDVRWKHGEDAWKNRHNAKYQPESP